MPDIVYLGRRYAVAAGETVLDCLLRHREAVPSDCRSGICQTCLMQAVRGAPPAASQQGLRDTEKLGNRFLACCCRPTEDLEVALPDSGQRRFAASVLTLEPLAEDIVRLRLSRPENYDYRAGQYLTLFNAGGIGRSYSLASVPHLDEYLELHIRLIPDGTLSTWVRDLRPSDKALVGPARGNCFHVPGQPGRPLLLICTGSGLGALYGVLRDALSNHHTGPIRLFHGAGTPDALYYRNELRALADRYRNLVYTPCVLAPPPVASPGIAMGRVEDIALRNIPDTSGWRVFLCGNADMVKDAQRRIYLAGAAARDIFADPFLAGR